MEQSGEKNIDGIEGKNARKKTNNKWFETQDSITYWDDFSKQKIVWASVGETYYSLIENKFLLLDTNYFFTTNANNARYLLGFLNSKLITFWINSEDTKIGNGGAYRHYKYNLEKLCIPNLKEKEKKDFISIVEKRLKGDLNAEIEIDNFIYQFYGFTKEEIEYIENL